MNADNIAYNMSVVRPSPDYVNRIAHYVPYRTTALESLNHQLFPEESKSHTEAVNLPLPKGLMTSKVNKT